MRTGVLWAVILAAAATAVAGTACASQDDPTATPRLEIAVDVEIQDDWTVSSDDPDAEINDLFTTTEPAFGFHMLPGLSIQGGLVLEPVDNTQPGEDRFFDEHGLYVEQLYLLYEQDAFSLYGGKFNPPFGIAWDVAPGVYGTEIGEDFYEQTERIGFGGALAFGGAGIGGDGFGEHRLSAQTFFADTTLLSEALGTERSRLRLGDGGPGNTEDLSSFSVTLDGAFEDLLLMPGYHLGLLRQAGGEGDPEDELGLAAALAGSIEPADSVSLEPLVEYVHFFDAGGQDQDRDIVTLGLGTYWGPWNAALAYSKVWTDPHDPLLEDLDVQQFQASFGYSFDFGLDVDVGYRFNQEEEIDSHTVGVLVHYGFGFAIQ